GSDERRRLRGRPRRDFARARRPRAGRRRARVPEAPVRSRARLVLALSFAACAAPPADLGATGQPIVDGTPETGRPAVVYLYRLDGAACTGAIIAPRVVLTANHC